MSNYIIMVTKHFISGKAIRKYTIGDQVIELEVNEHIFPPSEHGLFFANNIKVNPDEKVIDIGTGSGILGILAARYGGKVYATDSDENAVRLAERNAKRNGVAIDFSHGDYFSEFDRKFDVIIANLPQEIIPDEYKKELGDKLTKTMSGGEFGNEQLLELLDLAPDHMHSDSRIYLPVYTASDYITTLRKIVRNYDSRMVSIDLQHMKGYAYRFTDFYLDLNRRGKVKIFQEGETWKAVEYVFELRLKNNSIS